MFPTTAAVGVLVARRPRQPRLNLRGPIGLFGMTDREVEVAALPAAGLDSAGTGRLSGIQPGTVRNHLEAEFEKTGTRRRADRAAWRAQCRKRVPADDSGVATRFFLPQARQSRDFTFHLTLA